MRKIFLLASLFFLVQSGWAQVRPKERPEPKKDSGAMYRKIEEYSDRHGFTRFLHRLIFEPVRRQKKVAKSPSRKLSSKREFRPYQGKIVRKIVVTTLDPFGYAISDTTAKPRNYLSRLGNRIHLKSKAITIKNLIVFRKNQPFDSLRVRESERLIRAQRFVRGVKITAEKVSRDSVDVYIRELDSWSLVPDAAGSSSRAHVDLTERNFIGLGHEAMVRYERDFAVGKNAFSGHYIIPNIVNTYIRTALTYNIDVKGNYLKSVNVERPFFSPFTRWAAGAYLDQRFRWDTLPDASGLYARQNFKWDTRDFWAGHSVQVFRGNTENARTTNLITAIRAENVHYTETPDVAYDTVHFYADEKLYLGAIGVASRQFREDKYIFNYGIVEDVPEGRAAGLTGGWQEKNGLKRLYGGARVALGRYYTWGYLSSNFEVGSYFNHGNTEQSAFTAQSMYFTNLMEAGHWKIRQFIKGNLVMGINRVASRGDEITINDRFGIPGFTPAAFYGTQKLVLSLQTQGYSPWNLAGFRLNPYLSYSMGFLGGQKDFWKTRPYSQIGAGLIITNDYLVFSSFQLSLAYYPDIPGQGSGIFKTNAFSSEDFGLLDFSLGKPRLVNYE